MLFKKGEKYLLTYNIGNYTEVGTYIGIIHYDDNGIEHMFKANGRTVLVLEEENKEIKPNLMEELTEGIEALKERRNMERDRLDERLGKRDRVDQEELFAPHMDEEQYINLEEEPEELVEGLERYPTDERQELKFVTISKILVPTERDKEQLLKAFKYLHDHGFIDSEYYAVITIIHMYQNPDLIEIEK